MDKLPKYLVVELEALPEVFIKVLKAKKLIESGSVGSLSEATRIVDISRSAFYKYRDSIFPYEQNNEKKIAGYHFVIKDKTGVLSNIIKEFSNLGANILTINQSLPIDGYAPVTITVSLNQTAENDMELLSNIRLVEGVIEARRIDPL